MRGDSIVRMPTSCAGRRSRPGALRKSAARGCRPVGRRAGTTHDGVLLRSQRLQVTTLHRLYQEIGTLGYTGSQFGSRPERVGSGTGTGPGDTDWSAVGRACSFYRKNGRSSRFRSFGPPLREERYRSEHEYYVQNINVMFST